MRVGLNLCQRWVPIGGGGDEPTAGGVILSGITRFPLPSQCAEKVSSSSLLSTFSSPLSGAGGLAAGRLTERRGSVSCGVSKGD